MTQRDELLALADELMTQNYGHVRDVESMGSHFELLAKAATALRLAASPSGGAVREALVAAKKLANSFTDCSTDEIYKTRKLIDAAIADGVREFKDGDPLVTELIWEVDRAVKQAKRENGRYDTMIRHILNKHITAEGGKSSDGAQGKTQPASGVAAAPIETEDAGVVPSPSEATPAPAETDQQFEGRILQDEARDNLRLLDYIADMIGLPKDQELSRENFKAAWQPAPADDAAVAYTPISKSALTLGEPIWKETFAAEWLKTNPWQGFELIPLFPHPAKEVDVEAIAAIIDPVAFDNIGSLAQSRRRKALAIASEVAALLTTGNASSDGARP